MYTKYQSNNSGGGWWLSDQDWRNLEAAGWTVLWAHTHHECGEAGGYIREDDGSPKVFDGPGDYCGPDDRGDIRYLGALAMAAYRRGVNLDDAVAEWERTVGQSADEPGCSCCGQPHDFTEYGDDGKIVRFGPSASYDDEDESV